MFVAFRCFFPHTVINCTVWAIFSEEKKKNQKSRFYQSYLWGNAEDGPKVTVWATEKFQFATVVLLESSYKRNFLEKEIFWKKNNQMLIIFHPPSLFETYKTMWVCV